MLFGRRTDRPKGVLRLSIIYSAILLWLIILLAAGVVHCGELVL